MECPECYLVMLWQTYSWKLSKTQTFPPSDPPSLITLSIKTSSPRADLSPSAGKLCPRSCEHPVLTRDIL